MRRAQCPMGRSIARWCAIGRNSPTTSVGAWLEGHGPAPEKVAANADLAAQLKLQDKAAQSMLGSRFQHGALDLETIETHPVMRADEVVDIAQLREESGHVADRGVHGGGEWRGCADI